MRQSSLRILIVDCHSAHHLAEFLRIEGFDVETAHSGEEGLDRIASRAPDLLILDLQLPGMHGLEMLREIQKIQPWLPIVVVSSVDRAGAIATAMAEGVTSYLRKPVSPPLLVRIVNRLLATAGAAALGYSDLAISF